MNNTIPNLCLNLWKFQWYQKNFWCRLLPRPLFLHSGALPMIWRTQWWRPLKRWWYSPMRRPIMCSSHFILAMALWQYLPRCSFENSVINQGYCWAWHFMPLGRYFFILRPKTDPMAIFWFHFLYVFYHSNDFLFWFAHTFFLEVVGVLIF